MEKRFYYLEVKEDEFGNLICIGILDTFKERAESEYIPVAVYDASFILRKMWTGSEWVDNPNYITPQEEEKI